jgi:ribosomal-protein-alanine N-acetyltransferase
LLKDPTIKIGYAGIEEIPDVGLNDIRYGIANDYQELGYAYEAAKVSLDFVFSADRLDMVYQSLIILHQ